MDVALSDLLRGHAAPRAADPPDELQVPSDAAEEIIDAGRLLDSRFWVPATAGNLSRRLPDGRIAITRSGCHKGRLEPEDVILVDHDGAPLGAARPSAETLLHCQIYRADPAAGAVLHTHSVAATVLSLRAGATISLTGYEVMKAFAGITDHATRIDLPVFDNDQDIPRLARAIEPHFATGLHAGYVIRGHGVYAWGGDMPTALARLEALEFLLMCEQSK